MIILVSPYSVIFFKLQNMVLLLARIIHQCDTNVHVGLHICCVATLLILSATHRTSDPGKYPLEEQGSCLH